MISDLYQDNVQKVYRFFYYKTLDVSISQDLTSDTFMKFLEKYTELSDSIDDPTKYLYGIMKNIWLQHLQKKYRQKEIFIEDIDDFSAHVQQQIESFEDEGDSGQLTKLIDQLPESQRIIMTLRIVDNLTLKEICEQTGRNMNYVKTTRKRGVKSLKKIIENLPDMEEAV